MEADKKVDTPSVPAAAASTPAVAAAPATTQPAASTTTSASPAPVASTSGSPAPAAAATPSPAAPASNPPPSRPVPHLFGNPPASSSPSLAHSPYALNQMQNSALNRPQPAGSAAGSTAATSSVAGSTPVSATAATTASGQPLPLPKTTVTAIPHTLPTIRSNPMSVSSMLSGPSSTSGSPAPKPPTSDYPGRQFPGGGRGYPTANSIIGYGAPFRRMAVPQHQTASTASATDKGGQSSLSTAATAASQTSAASAATATDAKDKLPAAGGGSAKDGSPASTSATSTPASASSSSATKPLEQRAYPSVPTAFARENPYSPWSGGANTNSPGSSASPASNSPKPPTAPQSINLQTMPRPGVPNVRPHDEFYQRQQLEQEKQLAAAREREQLRAGGGDTKHSPYGLGASGGMKGYQRSTLQSTGIGSRPYSPATYPWATPSPAAQTQSQQVASQIPSQTQQQQELHDYYESKGLNPNKPPLPAGGTTSSHQHSHQQQQHSHPSSLSPKLQTAAGSTTASNATASSTSQQSFYNKSPHPSSASTNKSYQRFGTIPSTSTQGSTTDASHSLHRSTPSSSQQQSSSLQQQQQQQSAHHHHHHSLGSHQSSHSQHQQSQSLQHQNGHPSSSSNQRSGEAPGSPTSAHKRRRSDAGPLGDSHSSSMGPAGASHSQQHGGFADGRAKVPRTVLFTITQVRKAEIRSPLMKINSEPVMAAIKALNESRAGGAKAVVDADPDKPKTDEESKSRSATTTAAKVDTPTASTPTSAKTIAPASSTSTPPFLGRIVYDGRVEPSKLLDGDLLARNVGGLLEIALDATWLEDCAYQFGPPSDYEGEPIEGAADSHPLMVTAGLFELEGLEKRRVWGTDVYTDDSDVLGMCIHSGWLRVAEKKIPEKEKASVDMAGKEKENQDEGEKEPKDVEMKSVEVPEVTPSEPEKGKDAEKEKDTEKGKEKDSGTAMESEQEKAEEKVEEPVKAVTKEAAKRTLLVTLQVAPALLRYQGSSRQGLKSRSWGNGHDGVSLLVHNIKYLEEPVLPRGRRWLKFRAGQVASRLSKHEKSFSLTFPLATPPTTPEASSSGSYEVDPVSGSSEGATLSVVDTFILAHQSGKSAFVGSANGVTA